jgi:RND superfamily putative drug exporter
VDDPAYRAYVLDLQSRIKALGPETVERSTSYFESRDESLVSKDRRSTLIPVVMAGNIDDASEHVVDKKAAVEQKPPPGFKAQMFGFASLGADFNKVSEEDLAKGESFGILAALVILVVVFGAVVAGFIPILVGAASIALATAMVAVVGQIVRFSFFVPNMITMMGLAVGIDYSLFVVSATGRSDGTGGTSSVPSRPPAARPAGPCSSAA